MIQSICYKPQEYLEVVLNKSLTTQIHAYYLSVDDLLNCFIHLNTPSVLYFDTQYVMSFKHYLMHHVVTKNDLKDWILFLLNQFEAESEGIVLWNVEYIFIDEKSKKLILCKIPELKEECQTNVFSNLILQIYELMNFDGDDEWISQMYLILKSKPFKISLFRQFITSKKNKKWLSFFKKESDDLDEFFQMLQVKESQPAYGIPTTPFETQVLMAGFQYGYLVDEKKQQYFISSSPFWIGRNKECHCILNYPEVSKMHCNIRIEEGLCYIEDQNSTNGTSINQERLEPNTPILLKNEDCISVAGHLLIYYV